VDLADDGVARNTAELGGDGEGAEAFGPELFQDFDAFVSPRFFGRMMAGHDFSLSSGERKLGECACGMLVGCLLGKWVVL
jgi:hypothetical protein